MPSDYLVQYGAFGLVAALVMWSLYKGFPSLLDTHKAAIAGLTIAHLEVTQKLVATFEKSTSECREERLELARNNVAEREKDRTLLKEQGHQLAAVTAALKELSGNGKPAV